MDIRNRRRGSNTYTADQVKQVLLRSGISIESEVDSDYIIFCPFHGNHRTPAGEVDKKTGIFFCFACQYVTDLVDLVSTQSGRTYFQAVRFIKSLEESVDLGAQIEQSLIKKEAYTEYPQQDVTRLHEAAMASERAVSYYKGRKITTESMSKFELGYSEKRDMVTIPVHSPDGLLLGFVGRSVEGKDFKNTPGLPKGKTLFNLNRVKSSKNVYVVESSFDAIRLDQCGFAAVATLGSNVSNFQIDLLKKYFNDIIIIADNDEAGNTMVKKLKDKLRSKLSVISLDQQHKDVGDMTDDEIKALSNDFDKSISSMLQ
jgi:DNA primase